MPETHKKNTTQWAEKRACLAANDEDDVNAGNSGWWWWCENNYLKLKWRFVSGYEDFLYCNLNANQIYIAICS